MKFIEFIDKNGKIQDNGALVNVDAIASVDLDKKNFILSINLINGRGISYSFDDFETFMKQYFQLKEMLQK